MNQASSFLCDDILQQIFFTHSQQSSTALFGVEGEEYWRDIHKEIFECQDLSVHGEIHSIILCKNIKKDYEGAGEYSFAEWYFNWGEEAGMKVAGLLVSTEEVLPRDRCDLYERVFYLT